MNIGSHCDIKDACVCSMVVAKLAILDHCDCGVRSIEAACYDRRVVISEGGVTYECLHLFINEHGSSYLGLTSRYLNLAQIEGSLS